MINPENMPQGGLSQATTEETPAGAGYQVKVGPRGNLTPAGNITLDPTQNSELLAQMQEMVNRRQGPMNTFLEGLKDATAWGAGGAQGPTEALALRGAQRQKEEDSLYNMKAQMAAMKASESQNEVLGQKLGTLTSGTGGTGAGYTIPDEIKSAMSLAGNNTERQKIFTDWAKENAKIYAAPDMDKPTIPVTKWDAAAGEWIADTVSPREYRTGKYRDTAQTQTALQAPAAGNVPVSVRNNNPGNLVNPKTGQFEVFKTPEEGDKALETDLQKKFSGQSDAYKAKFGDAPLTPARLAETWSPATGKGNTPESTLNYGKQIAKSLGISPDQAIPNTPESMAKVKVAIKQFEAGDYMSRPVQNQIPARPVSAQQAQKEQDVTTEFRKKMAEGSAENVKKEEDTFLKESYMPRVQEQKNLAKRLGTLLGGINEKDNKVVGLLNTPGMGSAISKLLVDGVSTPVGSVGIKGLEDAYQAALPGVKKEQIEARREIAQILAQYSLIASQAAQGQGSMSDYERSMFQKIAGSTSDSVGLLKKVQETMAARAEFNESARTAYNQQQRPGRPSDYATFVSKSPEYEGALRRYSDRLEKLAEGPGDGARPGEPIPKAPTTGTTSSGVKWKIVQ